MRRIILSMMVSLDGCIARADGNLDWYMPDPELELELLALLRSIDCMLFGRVSYQLLEGYWPDAGRPSSGLSSNAREAEFASLMNSIPKRVYSRSLTAATWGPVQISRDVVAREIEELKRQPGKDIALFAGARLAQSFATLDLIDEYRLMVHPVILGSGIRLFGTSDVERRLQMQRTIALASGITFLQYSRA